MTGLLGTEFLEGRYDARGEAKGEATLPKHLKGRASFHLAEPSYLSLKSASLNDSGNYECRVDFLVEPSRTTYIKLVVVDPPKGLVIRKMDGDLITFTVTANLGDTLRLSCIATGGHPRPDVKWSVNRQLTDTTWDALNEEMTQNDLILLSLTRDLHQAKLSCRAQNSNITKPLRQEIILLLNLPPETVKISGIPDVLHSGRRYTAKCDVSGARPDPVIFWTIKRVGEKQIQVSNIVKFKNPKTPTRSKVTSSADIVKMKDFPSFIKSGSNNLISRELRQLLYKNSYNKAERQISTSKRKRRKVMNDGTNVTFCVQNNLIDCSFYKNYERNFVEITNYRNSNNNSNNNSYKNTITTHDIVNNKIIINNNDYKLAKTVHSYEIPLSTNVSNSLSIFKETLTVITSKRGLASSRGFSYQRGKHEFSKRYKRKANPKIISPNNNSVLVGNKSQISVDLTVDSSLNDAELTCKAISSALPNRPVLDMKKLNVYYAPRLHITLGSSLEPDNIREGMDVYFQCSADANPPVPYITWLHNEMKVRQSTLDGVLISAEHLVLQKVRRKWSGQIACRGANGVGAASSPPFELRILFIPVCNNSVSLVWAGIGEEVVVPCRVEAHPPNVTFHWTLTNSVTQERVSSDRVIVMGLESQLRYRPEKPHDYGRLQCWAENMLGRQKKPCVVTVKTAGSPSPPFNCSVQNQTWRSFDVACDSRYRLRPILPSSSFGFTIVGPKISSEEKDANSKGEKLLKENTGGGVAKLMVGRDRIRYLLKVTESEAGTLLYNVSSEKGKFRVTGLTPGLDYTITLSRFNNHGRSPEVTLEALTLRAAENRMKADKEVKEPDNNNMARLITGLILGLVLLVSFALLLCLKKRHTRAQAASTDRLHLPSSVSPTDAIDGFPDDGAEGEEREEQQRPINFEDTEEEIPKITTATTLSIETAEEGTTVKRTLHQQDIIKTNEARTKMEEDSSSSPLDDRNLNEDNGKTVLQYLNASPLSLDDARQQTLPAHLHLIRRTCVEGAERESFL